jgi:trehalose synthase
MKICQAKQKLQCILISVIFIFSLLIGPGSVQAKSDSDYIEWLEKQSMLYTAQKISENITGHGIQWRETYGRTETREIVAQGSVWVLGYPGSMITRPGESVLHLWGDEGLWSTFEEIGVQLLHTGPVKKSGGIREYKHTPTIDGWFDRISYDMDPDLGTEEEYRRMVKTATKHRGMIAGDLVPLHTGKGADFLLALRNYKDYPGIYTMVEIKNADWSILPGVKDQWSVAPVPKETIPTLQEKGYIPGYIDSADAVSNAHELSGWDATGNIKGVDGKTRRWVFLHYFKPGQPTLNWLDPTFAGPKIIAADTVKTIHDLGARVVRLDAVPFLGIEPVEGKAKAWGYQHPLAPMGTNYIAFLIRKLGGWSFQELNMPYEQIKAYTDEGADLSYDFFTRTESLHAFLTEDASLLRLSYREMLKAGINPMSLVHDLQNHDEITYQLVQLGARGSEEVLFNGKMSPASEIREQALSEMRKRVAGQNAPYNKLYRSARDGVATTFAGFVAASLGIKDPYNVNESEKEQIKDGHLLLALYNAMQHGVFSLAGWDLVGALPLSTRQVEHLLGDNDFRWINRGAIDMMDYSPEAQKSSWGLPKAQTLYGPLPKQLKDQNSFTSILKNMLKMRREYGIDLAEVVAVPSVKNQGVFLLVMQLPSDEKPAITAINFSRTHVVENLNLSVLEGIDVKVLIEQNASDIMKNKREGRVSEEGTLSISLNGLEGKVLVID